MGRPFFTSSAVEPCGNSLSAIGKRLVIFILRVTGNFATTVSELSLFIVTVSAGMPVTAVFSEN